METKVTVMGDALGNVITPAKENPEYGHVRIEQQRSMVDENGFIRRKTVSALLHGTIEDLNASNFFVGQTLPGRIIVQESLEPFNKKDPNRDLKVAGKTGIICRVEDQPIYRRTVYSTRENAVDVLISHTNKEELLEAYNREKQSEKSSAIKPSTSFSLND